VNRKKLLFILLIIGFSYNATAYTTSFINTDIFSLKIQTDSLKIDNSKLEPRQFHDLNDVYYGEDFVYERTRENSGWWTRFK